MNVKNFEKLKKLVLEIQTFINNKVKEIRNLAGDTEGELSEELKEQLAKEVIKCLTT